MLEHRRCRGYRPGRYGLPSLEELETERFLKLANIEMYAQRVGAGLPVFEDDETPGFRLRAMPPERPADTGTHRMSARKP